MPIKCVHIKNIYTCRLKFSNDWSQLTPALCWCQAGIDFMFVFYGVKK